VKYRVKTQIKHNGKVYKPGETIELKRSEAAAMPWAVVPESKEEVKEQQEKPKK